MKVLRNKTYQIVEADSGKYLVLRDMNITDSIRLIGKPIEMIFRYSDELPYLTDVEFDTDI